MVLPELAIGEYTFYAAAVRTTGFIDEIIGSIVDISLFFTTEPVEITTTETETVEITFDDSRLPDGVIGRTYSFAIEPDSGTPPYRFSLSSGTLPKGLTLDRASGLIQGEPTEREFTEFTLQATDSKGNVGVIEGAIKVYQVLSFGKDGTYKGCNGLQMAFNSVQDLDEIRLEQGSYECNGLSIPSAKSFEHGIKVSGGWDSSFNKQNDDPAVTVLDGGAKRIDGMENEEQCGEAGGVWKRPRCFQE